MKLKFITLIVLIASFDAFAAPPPVNDTFPLSVKRSTHIISPTDATSGMITDAMSAMTVKPWCRLVATTNVTPLSGLAGPLQIDSSGVNSGDLVLLTGQSAGAENGPWVTSSSGAWTRPAWYASGQTTQAFLNIEILVRVGTVNTGTWWRITNTSAITIDTTPTAWAISARVGSAAILDGGVAYVDIQDIAGLSVMGRSANSSGVGGNITGTDGQYLRVSGTTLGFGPFPTPTPFPSPTTYPSVTPFPSATPYPTPTPHIVTLTGDVTGAGSGASADTFAATIANDAVTTIKVLNGNITLPKIQNIPDGTILGNNSGGFGPPLALNSGQVRLVIDVPQTTRLISTTSPLAGGGDLSADRTLSIANAAADGTTKGAATFTAADFNAAVGLVSIDYTNGQAASGSTKGFLTAADWTTFNNANGTVTNFTAGTLSPLFTTSVATGTTTPALTFALTNAASHTIFGNFTGSTAAPSYNVTGAGVDTFLVTPSASNLRTAIASSAVTGTAGNLVFSGSPTFTGTVLASAITASGTLTLTGGDPQFLMSPVSGAVGFQGRIPTSGDYAQFKMNDQTGAQRGYLGYIGSTFSGVTRRDHFEFGSDPGTPNLWFRPGEAAAFVMTSSGNLFTNSSTIIGGASLTLFNSINSSGSGVIWMANGSAPTLPAVSVTDAGYGGFYLINGGLFFRGGKGSVTAIAPP